MDIRTMIQAEIKLDGGTENSSSLCKPVPNNENTHKGVCTDFFSIISSKIVNHLACGFLVFFLGLQAFLFICHVSLDH